MNPDTCVRVCIDYTDLGRVYFVRMAEHRVENGRTAQRPEHVNASDIRRSRLFSRESAVYLRNYLRASDYDAHVVSLDGFPLFEQYIPQLPRDSKRSVQQTDRVNMTIPGSGVLIVPGTATGWYIRFPGTNFESLHDATVEGVYKKLIENYPGLLQHAEKCASAPEPKPTPQQDQIQPRLRPADRT